MAFTKIPKHTWLISKAGELDVHRAWYRAAFVAAGFRSAYAIPEAWRGGQQRTSMKAPRSAHESRPDHRHGALQLPCARGAVVIACRREPDKAADDLEADGAYRSLNRTWMLATPLHRGQEIEKEQRKRGERRSTDRAARKELAVAAHIPAAGQYARQQLRYGVEPSHGTGGGVDRSIARARYPRRRGVTCPKSSTVCRSAQCTFAPSSPRWRSTIRCVSAANAFRSGLLPTLASLAKAAPSALWIFFMSAM